MEKKCRAAAVEAADEIIDENRAKACAASSKTVEFEQGGEMHTAAVFTVAQDGSALKRDYGHCYTGSAAAAFAVDKETGLVVDKGISQASCHYARRRLTSSVRNASSLATLGLNVNATMLTTLSFTPERSAEAQAATRNLQEIIRKLRQTSVYRQMMLALGCRRY